MGKMVEILNMYYIKGSWKGTKCAAKTNLLATLFCGLASPSSVAMGERGHRNRMIPSRNVDLNGDVLSGHFI